MWKAQRVRQRIPADTASRQHTLVGLDTGVKWWRRRTQLNQGPRPGARPPPGMTCLEHTEWCLWMCSYSRGSKWPLKAASLPRLGQEPAEESRWNQTAWASCPAFPSQRNFVQSLS